MSNREMCLKLLDAVPEYKIRYVLAYLQGLTADEAEEDAFCERMYQNYLNDPDPEKDKEYTLEDCKKEYGLL